jgi:tetratricopeptide (TPR) repeat protein
MEEAVVMMRSAYRAVVCRGALRLAILVVAAGCAAQTFDVNGQTSNSSAQPATPTSKSAKTKTKTQSAPRPDNETGMGWGSSIDVARQARAAQTALQHGDTREATEYAQHAVNAAPQNSELWFTLAYAARLSGQYERSVEAYRRGLALKPNSVQGLSGLAQTYARMGRNAEAQETLEQVLAANPRSDQDLQLAGELLLPTDPKKALEFLQRSEAAKPAARTELLMARAYARAGDSEGAHNMLERARRSAPRNPEVLRAVASYYRDTGDYKAALHILEDLHARDANTLAELAYTYTLSGDTHNAAVAYGDAANRAPRDIEIQLNAAQAMINAGEFAKAGALLTHAESLSPDHYRLFALRGRLAITQHRTKDAIREYEASLQHMPQGVPEGVLYPVSLRVDLADAYRDDGDIANADRVTKDAAVAISSIEPAQAERPEFLRLRAAVEVAGGNTDAAEKDLQQALQIEPRNTILLLNYANLLRKVDRRDEARKLYLQALAIDPASPAALGALGFLAREMGDSEAARKYFLELAKKHPDDYVPYLALGDLDSETRHFSEAQANYEKAFARSTDNPLIVAGAMNAALEAHHPDEAKQWLARSSPVVQQNPQVMREHERYLTMTGQYAESAALGYKVIEKLPKDREAVDYLAYDLLFLNRIDEAMDVVTRFQPVLEKDRDLPLISGYVHARRGDFNGAVKDFSRALDIDPDIAVGYMNRGYVYNDMRLATKAEQDFRKALALNPDYGEAHLGLAYALVQLRSATAALKEAEIASRLLPDSESLHLVKAESYRQRAMLVPAETEYRKALKLNPNAPNTYIALADVEYRARKYASAAETLQNGLAIAPNDAMILAQLGRSYARLERSADALQAIDSAERIGGKDYKVLLVVADALRILNRRDQAMTVYARALESSDENRLQVRLALGRLFAEEGKSSDAEQQVALAFAEARVSATDVTTADDYLNAADVLMNIHEYTLAQRMYGRAHALGADDSSVAVGMANAELAVGDTRSAAAQLASLPDDPSHQSDFEYQVTQGNVYRQLGKDDLALANFSRATQLDPEDPAAHNAEMELAEEEGRPITDRLGMGSGVRVNPVFEDDNIYQLDARLRGLQNTPALLPPPRRSVETFADSRFQFRSNSFPPIQGFVAERNAQGSLSFPSQLLIQNRNTFDTIFNFSVAPMVQIGNVKLNIMPGLQYTIRRDTLSPTFMNQNLFRQFLYLASSPIADWLSFSGNLIREAGPFTEQGLHSRDFSGSIDFRLGRPWAKTAFLMGYNGRNLLFTPSISGDYPQYAEYYQTISYAGMERSFGPVKLTAVAEFLRAWRIQNLEYTTAQTLRPRFGIDAKLRPHWTLSATGAWSSGRDFHAYDSFTSNVVVTYTRERGWGTSVNTEAMTVTYPMRFSFGFGQQSFYNFPGHERTQLVPVAQLNF